MYIVQKLTQSTSQVLFPFRNQNCFQIKQLLAIQYFHQQTLVSLDSKLSKDLRKRDQEKKVKFALSDTETADQQKNFSAVRCEQDDGNGSDDDDDQHLIIKGTRKNKNISPLLR